MALKILLADDSMTAQNMGKKILTEAGYEVVAVSNGAAAVKKIAEAAPHLCILDIYMPGYTGLEVCEKVKSAGSTTRIPVLLTVGKHEPYKPEDGARVRADGVIVKPFEASELLRAVQRFSQRMAGPTPARPAVIIPPAPPSTPPPTYERTVKLTREQIQEYMDPSLSWKRGATAAVASSQTASTADEMPSIAVAALEEKAPTPARGEGQDVAAMMDLDPVAFAVEHAPEVVPVTEAPTVPVEASSTASSVLAGFVDYLIAHGSLQAGDEPLFAMADAAPVDEPAANAPAPEMTAATEAPEIQALGDATPPHWAEVAAVGYQVPAIDPALEVAPAVTIEPTPDPDLEAPQEIHVANATEDGLQPTSRAEESKNVDTTEDPNLSPMEGLIDAVQPLEGGRLVIPEAEIAAPEVAADVAESREAAPQSATQTEAEPQPPLTGSSKRSRKSKEMRAVLPPSAAPETGTPAQAKTDVTEEIAAVLDLLGQTTSVVVPVTEATAVTDDAAALKAGAARVWMAEEIALSDSEASVSLEHEMRVVSRIVHDVVVSGETPLTSAADAEVAVSEEPMRDEKIASHSAGPETGGLPPGSGASPTQELAAAMAAAFGGALPQEDLARAEETQSISEEVRRFALGDAYKTKPGFGGAAIDEPTFDAAKLSAAIERAIDRLKPQIVAEILKELQPPTKQ